MPKILVVDDDPDFVKSTSMVLEAEGYEVIGAANSDEGLSKLGQEKPDLVILDVIMSTVLDGLSMSQQMNEVPEYKNVPILMVTSIANTDYAALFPTDEYINIHGFMTKPISPEQLLSNVKRLLS
ncbi:MAG: response regulator [Chloroflexota bacterium]|nr:response regulator [Chloroflexota bacterium]